MAKGWGRRLRRRYVGAVRGATSMHADSPEEIVAAVGGLIDGICADNDLLPADIISIIFTVTTDLQSINPATALRTRHPQYANVPLFCAQEPHYADSLPRVLRVLIHARIPRPRPLTPRYTNNMQRLRPDLS